MVTAETAGFLCCRSPRNVTQVTQRNSKRSAARGNDTLHRCSNLPLDNVLGFLRRLITVSRLSREFHSIVYYLPDAYIQLYCESHA